MSTLWRVISLLLTDKSQIQLEIYVNETVVFFTTPNHAQDSRVLERFVFINSFANQSEANV